MSQTKDRDGVTHILRKASGGDGSATEELMEALERELHKLASLHMRGERAAHTLQTTAVVHEAFVRLFSGDSTRESNWTSRQHFLAVASKTMRRVLVDHARSREADKRRAITVSIESVDIGGDCLSPDVIDIHIALEEFAKIAPRQAQLVELRFFGGLSLEEAAEVLEISARSADKDWALARSWLRRRLDAQRPSSQSD